MSDLTEADLQQAINDRPSERLTKWALDLGLATGHADTEQDLLDEVGAQIERLRAMTEWRPIESAPRDGTPVIVSGLVCGRGPGRWLERNASYLNGFWYGEYSAQLSPPTHWMPEIELPPAPAITEREV